MILWEIHFDYFSNEYRIIIKENLSDLLDTSHKSRNLVEFFRSNKRLKLKPILEFTHSLDTISIIKNIRNDYVNKFGWEIRDENLIEMFFEIGMGQYYDDQRIIPYLIKRIKKKAMVLDIAKKEDSKFSFKQVDIGEKINLYYLKRLINKSEGRRILDLAIERLDPKKKGILKFTNEKERKK